MNNETSEHKMKSNRFWEVFLELLKWVVGTVGLGLAGICINQNIQETELQIKRLNADATFLNAVEIHVENKRDLSEHDYLSFINTFITSPDIHAKVKARIKLLAAHIEESKDLESKIANRTRQDSAINAIEDENKAQLKSIDTPFSDYTSQASIAELEKKESEIAKTVPLTNLSTLDTIQMTRNRTTPIALKIEKTTYTLIGKPTTKWCKAGYYIEFNNTLRIGVNELNNTSAKLNFRDIENDKPEIIDKLKNYTMTEGEKFVIKHNNYRYEITLNFIGAAGKNPFTRAVYLTVNAYRQEAVSESS